MHYIKANTDWLANCRYGISVHWTAQVAPRRGIALPFQKAVETFDVNALVQSVVASGADYLIFTVTHALQMIPAPHAVVDKILPGRTCERDLIAEIAEALAARGKHLILYYNHSCNAADDPAWEQAVGYHAPSKQRFAENLCEIVAEMGKRYGELAKAWWFDSSYSLDPRGPVNSVSTDLRGFQFPWETFTRAAKAGSANRLVTYNAGINHSFSYTSHQDYVAGEMVDLNHPPVARYTPDGLQWHGWTCLDDRMWVYTNNATEPCGPIYSVEEIARFLAKCRANQAPFCFNVVILQDGSISSKTIGPLRAAGDASIAAPADCSSCSTG